MIKPEDISQEAWDASGDLLTTVTNDNHCWSVFDHAPDAYPGDLQQAIAHAIMRATKDENEACAELCGGLRHKDNSSESEDWVEGTFACQSAIRARQ